MKHMYECVGVDVGRELVSTLSDNRLLSSISAGLLKEDGCAS